MKNKGLYALFPLVFFVVVYLSSSVYLGDFYAVPVLVVFITSLIIAFLQFYKTPLEKKLQAFSAGAGDENILLMILIFLLAGAFGQLSKDMGAIESVVNFALSHLSPKIIIAGLFLIASFVSISLGTSVGTVVALAPIAVGLSENIPGSLAIFLGAVIGGAMFGDNLSFISDTTIAATRTQGVEMKSKFYENIKIVWLPIIITLAIYLFFSNELQTGIFSADESKYELTKILPYIVVFIVAILGLNVVWALISGIVLSLIIGLFYGEFTFPEAIQSINTGFSGMFELSIICLIIGGIVGIIRYNGGIEYILFQVSKRIDSPRKAEAGIMLLTALVNVFLANNTITIIIAGPIVKEIAVKQNVSLTRSASIMDTVSSFIQGIIPYGAQILAAVAIASYVVSPLEVIRYLYYPFLLGIFTILYIVFRKIKERTDYTLQD